ncbi:large conductance mechanosensitive channel protein MscL, partial [Dickeya dadantii]|nr:large conductance mechanosensitive channel protein MscL [Dickeya dadantii]
FMAIKLMNKLRRTQQEEPSAPPKISAEEKLLTEIRDLLKQQADSHSKNT